MNVFPRCRAEKERAAEKGIDIEASYRKWVVEIVGEELVEKYLVPSKKDEPDGTTSRVKVMKLRDEARDRRLARQSESSFDKIDRAFGNRMGRR